MKTPLERLDQPTIKAKRNLLRRILFILLILLIVGFLIPERPQFPVAGATASDWNHRSFWYEPWGASGVHKGIDIFASKHTALLSSTKGIILYTGEIQLGGKVIVVLGPKWRLHYYAHLESVSSDSFSLVNAGESIGTIGDSGNAAGKQPHVHYSVVTLLPYFWRVDLDAQGWKKMFYLNPHRQLIETL